jgi:imidazolonepropionase-like amidohydrolase
MKTLQLACAIICCCAAPPPLAAQSSMRLENGRWFDGHAFQARTVYVVDGVFRSAAPARVDTVIDLRGGYVVPPYGEAHNHNIAQSSRIDGQLQRYAEEGIFYVLNPNSLPGDRLTGRINTPGTLQAIFANGGLNVTGGHPWDLVQRNIARGTWKPENAEGAFYHTIDSLPDLERKWPAILAGKPDLLKIYLLFSDEHEQRLRSDHKGFLGLDARFVPVIVARAHEAGLRVIAHIENTADFRIAVNAGVDIIGHMPGYGWLGGGSATSFEITPEDAQAAAARRIAVITTVAFGRRANDPARTEAQARRDALHTRNLRLLKKAGVTIAIGSDNFGATSRSEALYLHDLGVFSNAELLRMWTETTTKVVFPQRRVGSLQDGAEASLLVLDADPLADFANTNRIRWRMMQGKLVGGT